MFSEQDLLPTFPDSGMGPKTHFLAEESGLKEDRDENGDGASFSTKALGDPTEIPPLPYRETGVAIPLSHCVSCGIADYRCYTPTSVRKSGLSQSKDRPSKGVSQKKLASEAYRAIGGVARNSIANRATVGHSAKAGLFTERGRPTFSIYDSFAPSERANLR